MRQFYLPFETRCIIPCYDRNSRGETNRSVYLVFLPLRSDIFRPATHKTKESFKPWSPSPKEIQVLEGAEPIACQGQFTHLLRVSNILTVSCRPQGFAESRTDVLPECGPAVSCPQPSPSELFPQR